MRHRRAGDGSSSALRRAMVAVKRLGRVRVVAVILLVWFASSLLSRALPAKATSVQTTQIAHDCPSGLDLKQRLGALGIFGSTWTQLLQKIDLETSGAWIKSKARVQVLGQQGYVKRDLPVYTQAFEGFELLGRPASGKIGASHMTTGDEFDVVLCLSFNTDHCLDSDDQFDLVGPGRKINRILGLRDVIWSKHKFCATMTHAFDKLDDKELRSVTFPCWVMPDDYDKMLEESARDDVERWISKPRSLGAGMGITIVDNLEELARERHTTHVVQAYMTDPLLLRAFDDQGLHKWDARTYVLVSSVVPVRAYVYSRGLVRLATSPYSNDCKSHNQTACLTNTSINKKVDGGASSHKLKDITWSFHHLEKYFADEGGMDYADLFTRMQLAIGTVLVSAESAFVKQWGSKVKCTNCYQLLGVDVIFDSAGNARVVEVNGEPSLRLTSGAATHYDVTKKSMARDLVALVYASKSGHGKLVDALAKLAKCAGAKPYVAKSDLRYALDMFRESTKLGGFRAVYPNKGLHWKYRTLLEHLDKHVGGVVHGDGARLRTHDLIGVLIGAEAVKKPSKPLKAVAPEDDDDGGDDDSMIDD